MITCHNIFNKLIILSVLIFGKAYAGEVNIVAADFYDKGKGRWSVSVALKHNDTGWNHYADKWRVLDAQGNVLAERVLLHPHVNEQPFTRSLGNVLIPQKFKTVYIAAHDKKHGWAESRLLIDLTKVTLGRLKVVAK